MMKAVVIMIAALGFASAQSPTPDELNGVWVLDASRSRIPPGSASAPSALEFVKIGSDVRTVQVWLENGGRSLAVLDYRVEQICWDRLPCQTFKMNAPPESGRATNFRARCTSAARSSMDELWSLSGDGRELVIRRTVDVGPQADVQILCYKRSTEISLA
jgi:hypothetical protein